MEHDALTIKIADALRKHQLTRGMAVTMGSTCDCRYWTGQERPGKTRPVGYQGLTWHQAEVIADVVQDHIAEVPDVNEMNRGFGNCPHCRAPRVAHCHECLNDIERDAAHAAGWRMDHLSGYGCIAVCPDCRNDNTTKGSSHE